MQPKVTHITIIKRDGIIASCSHVAGQEASHCGDPSMADLVDDALSMFKNTTETSIRVVVGDVSVHCVQGRSGRLALVVKSGHPVVKSVARILRRLAYRQADDANHDGPSEQDKREHHGCSRLGKAFDDIENLGPSDIDSK